MAIFLSRIKKALNLGTKSITQNGTYNASSDGYDGYSSVEVNVAGVTPTPITPSNASPAALTSGSAVSPTANGYAISNYSNLSPSNSSPAAITNGDIYKAMANGKAISSLSEVAPSNAMPPDMYSGSIYKIKTRNGLLISTANYVSPSDSNPPLLSVDNSWYQLMGASGYLYSSSGLGKCKAGSFTWASSGTTKVTVGFKPKQLTIINTTSLTTRNMCYDERQSTTKFVVSTSSSNLTSYNIGDTNSWRIKSIDNDGFTLTAGNNNSMIYFAIG